MNIEGKDVSEIIEHLKTKFDDGARWIAYQKDKESIGKNDLHFFTSCTDADLFCEKSSSGYFDYRFTSVEQLISKLQNSPLNINQHDKIYEAWSSHPIEYMFGKVSVGIIEKLNRSELIPVTYKKDFIPRDEIGSYHVVELSGYRSSDQSHKIIQLSFDAEKTKQFYHDEFNIAAKDPLRRLHQFLLIGEFKNCSLKLEYGAMPVDTTGLLLSMSSPIVDEFGIVKHRDYKTLHELDEPTFVFQSVFAKYNEQSRTLNFYNDKLEQVHDLMKVWSLINVSNYDGGPAVTIKRLTEIQRPETIADNALNKKLSSEKKDHLKEKHRHGIKPKNRM